MAAPALPGTLVVNLGDLAQRWTSDAYKSTWHRVHNRSGRARFSVPFFCNCDFDAPVECVGDPLGSPSESGPMADAAAVAAAGDAGVVQGPKYEPITAGVYIMEKLGLMRT